MERGRTISRSPGPVRRRVISKSQSEQIDLPLPSTYVEPDHGDHLYVCSEELRAEVRSYEKRLASARSHGKARGVVRWLTRTLQFLLMLWLLMWAWLAYQSLTTASLPNPLLSKESLGLKQLADLLRMAPELASMSQIFHQSIGTGIESFNVEADTSLPRNDPDTEETRALVRKAAQLADTIGTELLSLEGWTWFHVSVVDYVAHNLRIERTVYNEHLPMGIKTGFDVASWIVPPLFPLTLSGALLEQIERLAKAELPGVDALALQLAATHDQLDDLGAAFDALHNDLSEKEQELLKACETTSEDDCKAWLSESRQHVGRNQPAFRSLQMTLSKAETAYEGLGASYRSMINTLGRTSRLPHVAMTRGIEAKVEGLLPDIYELARRLEEDERQLKRELGKRRLAWTNGASTNATFDIVE